MSYLSLEFALFIGLALAAFYSAPCHWRSRLLLGFSLVLYASWGAWQTLLLLGVTGFVYVAALMMERCKDECGKGRVAWLVTALVLLLLAVFKIGAEMKVASPSGAQVIGLLIAPLGLSYYLFRLLGYLLDVYWEKIPGQRSFTALALYASFFPQIVSGPIQRAGDFFAQMAYLTGGDESEVTEGLRRILLGLVKKIVIADRLGAKVDNLHANLAGCSPAELLIGAYGYAWQLYFDFSGMTDIALGIGLLFGIRGPENFQFPFFSPNIQEFWRRWHISLTSWLSDYLFLPLRMVLRGWSVFGLVVAIMANMLAVGIWHGPKWTYATFGVLNGIFLVVSVFTLKARDHFFKGWPALRFLRLGAGPLITFHLIAFNLIFFRAETEGSAVTYLKGLMGIREEGATHVEEWIRYPLWKMSELLVAALLFEAILWKLRQARWRSYLLSAPRVIRWSIYYTGIVLVVLSNAKVRNSIYAQF